MLAKLDTLIDYSDADEWAAAVRMCELPVDDQRAFFAEHLLAAVDSLAVKLTKRKTSYDIAGFRSHVALAIERWSRDGS
ncbi:MAG: hypothetical protein RIC55_29760 [Pirellulaceae bacterium]